MENTPEIFDKLPEFSHIGSFSFVMWAILIGVFLSLVVNTGPAFITLVQTSIDRGFRSAAWFALGFLFNDAMIIALCILTSVQVVTRSSLEVVLFSIGAGLILVAFGIYTFQRTKQSPATMKDKSVNQVIKEDTNKPAWIVMFGKGFVLNIMNPVVWVFWFSAVAIVAGRMGGDKISTLTFFGIILAATLVCEMLKAWGAAKLKVFFNERRTMILNKVAGVLLMGCGAYFIVFKGIVLLI